MPLTATLRLTQGSFELGKVDFRGAPSPAPLQASGQLKVDRLPVQAFRPYFSDAVNIDLLRTDASAKGQLSFMQTPEGLAAEVAGDVGLNDF